MTKSNKKSKTIKQKPKSSKEEKLFQNLLKVTVQFISGKSFVSMSIPEFKERLSLPDQHNEIFLLVLEDLVKQGMLEYKQNRYYLKKRSDEAVTGTIRMHPRGFGFVQLDDTSLYQQDIFIPKHLTQNAVDGDTVEVIVNTEIVSEKGPEGKVISILTRGRTHLAGIIRSVSPYGEIVAYVPLLGSAQKVIVEHSKEFEMKVGDRLVMEVKDWGSKDTETLCKASQYLGHISDPSCDIKAAIEEFEIRSTFPMKAILEAQALGKQVLQKEIKEREDIRELECFTIDPDTAKDFDDALTLTKDKKGRYHLGVHIADVSHYVRPGSALDLEAQERCNSTYFPGTCIPMLPSELSENLCSLKPNVNRLTISVFVDFDQNGNTLGYRIARTVIKSAKRFTYKEAKQVLDGKKKSPHAPTLHLMVELCGLLKQKRYERGSLEFAMPELIVLVDDKGVPLGTEYITYDITHQLVEEFMLKANEIVATHLAKMGKNLTYRIHDIPAEENMKDFSILARAFGFNLSEKPTPRELQDLFEEALETSYGQYLATSYIRRMRLALYSPDNIGHYGLGLTHYCHFTSPIRRYVDLVVHRILFGESDERESLDLIADRCSEQERISAKAENNVHLLKKLRLLESVHSKEPNKQYEAVVTRVKNFGVSFDVLDFMLESFLHVSELADDYYIYDDAKALLYGRRTHGTFSSGDRILVMLKKVDFITLESEWSFVATLQEEKKKIQPEHPKKRSSKSRHAASPRKRMKKGKPPLKSASKKKPLPKKIKKK